MGTIVYRNPFAPTCKVAKLVSVSFVGVLVKEEKHVLACHWELISNRKETDLLELFTSIRILSSHGSKPPTPVQMTSFFLPSFPVFFSLEVRNGPELICKALQGKCLIHLKSLIKISTHNSPQLPTETTGKMTNPNDMFVIRLLEDLPLKYMNLGASSYGTCFRTLNTKSNRGTPV